MEANPAREQLTARSDVMVRVLMATVLIVSAIAALAITSLIHARDQAAARDHMTVAAPTSQAAPSSGSAAAGEVGPFAFGHLEFDWNPAAPGGVPGFDTWPPVRQP